MRSCDRVGGAAKNNAQESYIAATFDFLLGIDIPCVQCVFFFGIRLVQVAVNLLKCKHLTLNLVINGKLEIKQIQHSTVATYTDLYTEQHELTEVKYSTLSI